MKFPETAFVPFFDDYVKVEATRPGGQVIRGTFTACVMPIADADPFTEDSAQSKVMKFTVMIPSSGENGWLAAALGSRPQIGDRVELADGTRAAVTKVSPLCDTWYEMEVRSC